MPSATSLGTKLEGPCHQSLTATMDMYDDTRKIFIFIYINEIFIIFTSLLGAWVHLLSYPGGWFEWLHGDHH